MKEFSDGAFRSYVSFPYVDSNNTFRNSWVIEVFVVEELFNFSYPFVFPKSFLCGGHKNDLRLKLLLIQSLSIALIILFGGIRYIEGLITYGAILAFLYYNTI